MAFTVIWYGMQGVVDQAIFLAEKTAKEHAISMFKARKRDDGVVSVEIRKDSGTVIFSYAEN